MSDFTNTAILGARAALQEAQARVDRSALGHWINGLTTAGDSTRRLDVYNPANGTVIASIPSGDRRDVDRAVAAASAAFGAWRAQPPSVRARIFDRIAAIVDENADSLAALESLNTGKPLSVSRDEIPQVAEVFRFMGGAARSLQSPSTEEYVVGHVSMIRREPIGVVGAVTPWNYPLLTASWKIASALAMGNTMVLKPSELTPLTTIRFMELVSDVLPPGVLNVVLGTGAEVGSALSTHPGIGMISLTGSVASGQFVLHDAAESLKVTHLELGGKAPVVVFADADLTKVARSIRSAGYWNSGQECGAAARVLCDKSIEKELVQKLRAEIATLRVGDPAKDAEIEMGALISAAQRDRVSGMVERARETGATIAIGGETAQGDGFFYPPTLITDVVTGSEISRVEVFGPVVTVETFDDEVDAVTKANATDYGLSASVWTENVGTALRVSSALDFGTVWVNSHLVVATEMPWGGFGASGHGRELSVLGLEDFSRTKHVMISTEV